MEKPHRTTESRLKEYTYVNSNELCKYEPRGSEVSSSAQSSTHNLLIQESSYDHSRKSISFTIDIENLRDKETNLRINRGSDRIDTSS